MAAGVADGLLAFGVGPAGAVGDQLAVVADEQPADDVPDGAQLGVAGLDQCGADVVPEAEVAAGRIGVAGACLGAALLVFGDGVTRTKTLGTERMTRKLSDTLPGGDSPLRTAIWELMRPMLSPALVALNRDVFVIQDASETTVNLAGRDAASSLEDLDLGEACSEAA